MSKLNSAVTLALAVGLTSCSTNYDCSNSDVRETLANTVLNGISGLQGDPFNGTRTQFARAKELVSDIEIVDIQTILSNDEHTRYQCTAKYKFGDMTYPVDYNVNTLANSESPFEIEYDRTAAQAMASNVLNTARSQAQ